MVSLRSDARTMVKEYFHSRREEMEEIHDAFGVKTPSMTAVEVDEDDLDLDPGDQPRISIEELDEINNYLDNVSREVHADFDVRHCTWADVLGKLRDANEAVAQRMNRDATLWSKGGAVVLDMSSMFQPALQAIPDELCFIHGGLALVLHLAKGRDKTKRDIVDAFEDVAHTFAVARSAVEHFPTDAGLRHALYKLRGTLFDAIPLLVSILVPKRLPARLAAPFRTSQSDRLVESIRKDTIRVQNRARALTDHHQNESTKQVDEIHDGVVGIQEGLQELHQEMQVMVKYALASQDGMAKMLSDAVEMFNYHKQRDQSLKTPKPPSQPTRRRSSAASPGPDGGKLFSLQCILDVKRGHETQDLAHLRRQEQQFDARSKDSVASILRHPTFQKWMATDTPDLVYIEGKLEKWYGKTSPISYFCAQLVWKLKESPPTTATLHYFCGQHVASNDPLRGPRGLMRSLVSQLLRVWPVISLDDVNLEGIDRESSISIHELCHLFEMVAYQVPHHHTIMCIIDDVNRLERDEWVEDYWVLMSMLGRMASESDENEEDDLRFKVLLTSPNQSRWLRDENRVDEAHRVLVTDNGWACR